MKSIDGLNINVPDTVYIGIDPGKSGAIAVLLDDGKIYVDNYDMGIKYLFDLLRLSAKYNHYCCIEKVHSFPGQGVASTFSFGKNYGIWVAMLESNNIRYTNPTPQAWIKHYIELGKYAKKERKNKLKAIAQRLHPNTKVTLRNADAILLAHYAKATRND
tara:strand:- start:33 stop:512 length:480 start_codon:yes stop_codon:yes gene_type:complete